jgi:hypothetical protein
MTHPAESDGLGALLSYAFVAFTIEVDNGYGARMPQRTTRHGGTATVHGKPQP